MSATLVAVAAISAAIIAYELVLMRLFAIIGWHHFAYMIISIALLGFGASGSALALTQARLLRHFNVTFAACAVLFAASAVLSFAAAMRLPFNALAIVWDVRQLLWLGLTYLLLILPFFFGAAAIGLAFSRYSREIGRVYAFDLVGAGLGALGTVGLLFALSPAATLRLIAAAGLLAAGLALLEQTHQRARPVVAALTFVAVVISLWLPPGLIAPHPHISQYKGLATALLVPEARILEERSSPLGLVSVVESPAIPFRHAPGLSLNNVTEPPPQIGIFIDADSLSALTRFTGDLGPLEYLDYTTTALPYHLLEKPKVLVLGSGGGEQVLLALYHRAREIDAVEINPQVLDIVAIDYADFAGGIYSRPEVDVHVGEARSFARRMVESYDLIQIPLLYSFAAAAAGTQGLHESYTYTVEAMRDYMQALAPGGFLSITLWLKLPPRDTLKLFDTAVEALDRLGIEAPGTQLALIRSWKTTTLLVKNGAFVQREIEALVAFAAERSFDVDYYAGISPGESNRYNILDRPYFYEAATALVGPDRRDYRQSYKFAIEAATDDRPYFFDFFRWRSLPELWQLRAQRASMLDTGYLILFATLIQAAILSLLLILAPLALKRRRFGGAVPKSGILAYFLAVGLAFMFIEIAYIQRFILFLGHPLYAVAVVLAGFLVFAGIGSALATSLQRALKRRAPTRYGVDALRVAAVAIGVVAVFYLVLLPPLLEALIALPDAAKIAVSLALIGPLACFMGMPFPLGVAYVARNSADLVPWAWGINGCASVNATILATLLAIHFGFTAVVSMAVALYLAAPLALRRPVTLEGGMSAPHRAE